MRRLSFGFLAFFTAAAGAQNAKLPSAAEQALIESNSSLNRALASGDTSALAPLLAGDLVYSDPSGATQSRPQLLSAVAAGYRVPVGAQQVTSIRIDGSIGLLDFQTKIATTRGDSIAVQSSAVYVLRGGHWQLTSLHSTGAPLVASRIQPPAPPPPPVVTVLPRPIANPPLTPAPTTGSRMTARATGTFQVDTKPLSAYNPVPSAGVGRFSIDKQYHGDIEGTGKGEMLTAGNAASGSAGYVAIEYVTATLRGKKGSFALQHLGTMDKGSMSLAITVVPASGTGGLTGIAGTMSIAIENGKHSYVFDYSLPAGQ